jgi:hypothetical protein
MSTPPVYSGPDWYAASDADGNGDGSLSEPFTLAQALASTKILPGHTLWIRGGTYSGSFTSLLSGTAENPVNVRAYQNEAVTLDGDLVIGATDGSKAYQYWHMDTMTVLNSNTDRGNYEMPDTPGFRATGITVHSPNSRIMNGWVRDTGNSMGHWATAPNSEVYGMVALNSGWVDVYRGHGHGLYTQNNIGNKTVKHCVLGPHFGRTLACYGTSPINGFRITENAFIDEPGGNILVGGQDRQDDQQVNDNHIYGAASLGYTHNQNGSIQFLRNVVRGSLVCKYWETIDLQNNIVISLGGGSAGEAFEFQQPADTSQNSHVWNNNQYHYLGTYTFPFQEEAVAWYTFEQWKAATGFDANSTYDQVETYPDSVHVYPNAYKDAYSKREGIVVIWNEAQAAAVNVDLTAMGLTNGGSYRIINALNWDEYVDFTYDGSPVSVPMAADSWTVAIPTGWDVPLGDPTWPKFGAFVIEKA